MIHRFAILPVALVISFGALTLSAQTVNDKLGFQWDLRTNGMVNDGTSDTFDGGIQLYVNDQAFNSSTAAKLENGVHTYGPVTMGKISVTRKVALSEDPPGLIYVDTFENGSEADQEVRPSVRNNYGTSGTSNSVTGKKGGVQAFLFSLQPPRSSVVYIFGEKSTRYLPKVNADSGNATIGFPAIKLKPKQEKSVIYFVAQRNIAEATSFRDQRQTFVKAVRQMVKKGRFDFVNMPGLDMFNIGDMELIPQGKQDVLHSKQGDQVFGKILTQEFTMQTELGKRILPLKQIVNLIGIEDDFFRVISADGGILTGKLTPETVSVELSDGATGEVSLSEINRIVPARPVLETDAIKQEQWFTFTDPIFVYQTGDRISGQLQKDTIAINTGVGKIDVPTTKLRAINYQNQEPEGLNTATITTIDGQKFSGMLYEPIDIIAWGDVKVSITPDALKAVYFVGGNPESLPDDDIPADVPVLELNERDFLIAKILTADNPLEFETVFGKRTFDARQVLKLKSMPGLGKSMMITLWDGSNISGTLVGKTIDFEVLERNIFVPPSRVRAYRNPRAVPPQAIREGYEKLIKQLGSSKFSERKAAYDELEKDVDKIRGLIQSAVESANPETQARLLQLLEIRE